MRYVMELGKNWRLAKEKLERAEEQYRHAAYSLFAPGRIVYYRHGGYEREVRVLRAGSRHFGTPQVYVRNPATGVEYWLDCRKIIRVEAFPC